MSRFANGSILSMLSRFTRQCKMSIQNFCLFIRRFKTSIWCCILTHIFFCLNTENNANPYIIKLLHLSGTRKCGNEPQGTLFSWSGLILFLRHQSDVMNHSWPLAMDHICKNKKPCLHVHKKNFSGLLIIH